MHGTPPDVPDYVVVSPLGEGAQGVVHQAIHTVSEARVALKRVPIRNARVQVALETEVLAMARLNHPHVLSVYDHGVVGRDDARWMWMAVELASGGALTAWQPQSWDEVEPVLADVLTGLAHAHARGMVHRDLKPENLLRCTSYDHRPGLKIGDFGLATVRGVQQAVRRGGTPLYMPPEQAEPGFGPLGPWTDLYALGAVLWEWCTGAPPFDGPPLLVLTKHLGEALPPFRPRFPLPDAVPPLLHRMLAKRPEDRPDAVAAVQQALGWVPTSVPHALSQASAARSSARLPGIGLGLLPLRDARLVGRHAERQVLTEALEATVTGWRPEVVLIHGPAGVGKTRLMRWIAETAAEAGVARLAWEPEDVDRALTMAWRGPVVACFDALDVDSEVLVSALAFAAAPVLVVATTRNAAAWPQLDALPRVRRLGLSPMEPTPFRTFLHGELGLSEALTVRMDERCGFVPGVASTWMQQLAQRGRLLPSPTGFVITDDDLATPPSPDSGAEELLRGLLAMADDEGYGALRAAALLGRVVDGTEWAALLDRLDLPYPEELLSELARADLIVRDAVGFAWVTPSVQAAALDRPGTADEHLAASQVLAELPPTPRRTARQGLHLLHAGRVAEGRAALLVHRALHAPEDAELARHLVEAVRPFLDDATEEEWFHFLFLELRVLTNLVSAQAALPVAGQLHDRLRRTRGELPAGLVQGAREAMARVFSFTGDHDRALEVLAGLPDDASVLRCRAIVATELGRHGEAEVLYRRAMAATDDEALQARLRMGMGANAGRAGRHEEALAWFEQSLACIEPELRHHPLGNMARSLLLMGQPERALPHAREAFERARRWGAQRLATEAVVYGIAAALADDDELEGIAEQALYSARRYGLEGWELLVERLQDAAPEKASSRGFLEAMRYALDAEATIRL